MQLPIQTELVAAFEARNASRIASLYADDAVFITPGRAAVVGREAVAKVMIEDLQDPGFSLKLTEQTTKTASAGDLAYSRGRFSVSFTNPSSGQVERVEGNYLQIFRKKVDDRWEILEDISSPAPPGDGAGT
jgi:uncharacterized protein (TIGR02246 family)